MYQKNPVQFKVESGRFSLWVLRGMGAVLPRIPSHHGDLTRNEGGISVDHLPDLCAPLPSICACLHS